MSVSGHSSCSLLRFKRLNVEMSDVVIPFLVSEAEAVFSKFDV